MLADFGNAIRLLVRSPLFTATAVLSLAIAIGATTTVFTLADAMLLRRPIGVADPDRVVDIGRTRNGREFDNSSYPNYQDIATQAKTVGVYAVDLEPSSVALGGESGAERVYCTLVSGDYFQILGVTPQAGRLLTRDDDRAPGAARVAVLSDRLWRRRFSADRSIVGKPVVLNGTPFTIIGVAPPGFRGTTLLSPELWAPMTMAIEIQPRRTLNSFTQRGASWTLMGGRLAPGVSIEQAQAEIDAIAKRLEEMYPESNKGVGWKLMRVTPVPGEASTYVAAFMAILGAIVGLVLLVASINIAGMMLARAAARRKETAVRLALGASRFQLVRQLLVESLAVFLIGGAAGLLAARWMTTLLLSLLPAIPIPLTLELPLDARVVVFGLALTSLAGLATGLLPAFQASKPDLVDTLKGERGSGFGRFRLRQVLVAAQIAGSVLLIVVAGLFARALQRAASIHPGFDSTNVEIVGLDLSLARHDDTTGPAFLRQVVARIEALPGVQSATAAIDLPLDGGRHGMGDVWAAGKTEKEAVGLDDWNVVEPGYFRTLRMQLARGRDFEAADIKGRPDVAIVNEAAAAKLWPGEDAIGRRLVRSDGERTREVEVVGVERTSKYNTLNEPPTAFIYLPYAQAYMPRVSLVIRTSGATAIPAVRAVIAEMNPHLPVIGVATLDGLSTIALLPQRVAGGIAGALGAVALLIAGIGVYGVIAYSVARRTREFGIRVALGATPRDVLRLVFRQGAVLTASGLAVGLLLALASTQLLASLLFGVGAADPVTFGIAAGLFGALSLAASFVPARRALAIDPTVALRSE
jgi:putative ABC transport system permease protein